MLGLRHIEIDASNFLRGMSSGGDISDGGFSPDTEAVNPIIEPGVLFAPAAAADADSDNRLSTTIEIIASAPDMANLGVDNRLLVGANSSDDGTFYRYNGTKIIAAAYATDTTRNYVKGYTDIITYRGEAYVTSQSHIARWQNDNTITQDFFVFTTSNVPHPALVFEDNAYYGDNNLLLRQTSVAGTPATILTLAVGEIIIALGIEPGSGKMLIATTSSLNMSNTLTSINKLYWYDGSSNKTLKAIYVEDQILGFHSVAGITYCGYGQNLGYITGSGIKFLRKLINVTLSSEELPYKHNMTSIGSTLYVADGNKILAYGPIKQGGENVFYYCARNKVNNLVFQSIFNVGSNKIGYSFLGEFRTVDFSSSATLDSFTLITNWLAFPRPVFPRSVYLEYLNQIASTDNFTISYTDRNDNGIGLTADPLTQTSVRSVSFIGFRNTDSIRSFRLTITNATENDGLIRVIIYYDFAE